VNALDRHAETVMARVRGVLGAHAPDLLLAFEGLVLMDSLTEGKPEPEASKDVHSPEESKGISDEPARAKCIKCHAPLPSSDPICPNCKPSESAPILEAEVTKTNGVHEAKPEPRVDKPVEVMPATPPILERPVVPPRDPAAMPTRIKFPTAGGSFTSRDFDALIAEAPKMAYPHDPHDLIQCVRAWAADAEDTRQKIKGHLKLNDQAKVGQVQWAVRWVEYHAAIFSSLRPVECAEYLQKLLLDRQRVKKEAA
jgi:hypothetical protein